MSGSALDTPMMRQYLAVKAQHPDAIVFYRMGDFYEMFLRDAELAAPLLDIALTTRDKGKPDPVPMCGVPVHAADQYLARLAAQGLRVAICEQVEEAGAARKLVRREVYDDRQALRPGAGQGGVDRDRLQRGGAVERRERGDHLVPVRGARAQHAVHPLGRGREHREAVRPARAHRPRLEYVEVIGRLDDRGTHRRRRARRRGRVTREPGQHLVEDRVRPAPHESRIDAADRVRDQRHR
jgi:hypothetical protein